MRFCSSSGGSGKIALFASEVPRRGILTPYPQEIVYSTKNGDLSQ